jgi:hypothetical protein
MRDRGGYVGFDRVPSFSPPSASGVWTLREAEEAQRAGTWPMASDDPFFSNVSLLMSMNGANGSTTFTDSSSNAMTATREGSAVISTAQSKFGGASGFFNGGGALLFTPTASTQFGTSDFTVEFWLYATSSPQDNQTIISFCEWPNITGFVIGYSGSSISVYTGNFQSARAYARGANNEWHHYALCRSAEQLRMFVNGQIATATASVGAFTGNFTDGLKTIGKPTDSNSFRLHGYLDDLRVTKGVARYENNFTPPQGQF